MNQNAVYLVTGAAGFLGGSVCRQLVEQGATVRAFVLPGDKSKEYIPTQAEIVEGDVCDPAALQRLFDVPDNRPIVVLHIASIVSVNPEFSQKVWDVNVQGTCNIIKECLKHKDRVKLVYCGSTGSIPELPKGQPIREIDRYEPGKVLGCYSQTKAEAAQCVMNAVAQNGLDACIVHPTGIMGPVDFAIGEVTRSIIRIIKGELPAGIAGSFNMVDVRDLAAGIIAAADKGRAGQSYILGNDEVSFKDFAKILHDEAHCPKVKVFLPIGLARIMARILEKKAKKNGGKPLLTTFSVYNLARNNRFDSSKARAELGFKTRPYRETLHDAIAWLQSAGLV